MCVFEPKHEANIFIQPHELKQKLKLQLYVQNAPSVSADLSSTGLIFPGPSLPWVGHHRGNTGSRGRCPPPGAMILT